METITLRPGADREQTILSALAAAGVTDLDAPCGGRGLCGKCAVQVTGRVRLSGGEIRSAENELLPACRTVPLSAVQVHLPERGAVQVAAAGTGLRGAAGGGLGLAVDIGTTTVAVMLFDLADGTLLGSHGERNAQRVFGADVISRIDACRKGSRPALRDRIRGQITEIALRLCGEAGRSSSGIRRISVAGNTVMEHLFADLDPSGIGTAPFTPASLFGSRHPSAGYLPGLDAGAEVYLCPCVSGYVGGDITAGLAATGVGAAEGLLLFADIGTNGELALVSGDHCLTCATAAGPAFEGAEIACGMDASPGAIDRVCVSGGDIAVHVIGGGAARGLCGSGLIDAVAALLDLGVIDETGRLAERESLPGPLAARLFVRENGKSAVTLQDGVFLEARDVRQVQLAKAAVRAGAETLLARAGKTAADLTDLVIAGGFGSFLDARSARRIGLLPPVPLPIIRHAGNAAGTGASMALTEDGIRRIAGLAARCEYLELSSARDFMDRYIECMMFDEGGSV